MLPINTILHPTDFSQQSDDAFGLACSLAKDHGARLIVLHVREIPVAVYGEFGHLPVEPEDQGAIRERLTRVVPTQPAVRIEHHLISGDAATGILRFAETVPCDLIVMGTHGRTGLGRLVMGSVADQVVRKAPCAVLTVKGPFRRGCTLPATSAECRDTPRVKAAKPNAAELVELGVGD
jgi:nucleotide-binding universal stress UspA family protein